LSDENKNKTDTIITNEAVRGKPHLDIDRVIKNMKDNKFKKYK